MDMTLKSSTFSRFLIAVALLASLSVCTHAPAQTRMAAPGRLAPPALACNRNQLTSWSGVVTGYTRNPASTTISVETDWDTQAVQVSGFRCQLSRCRS